jgi:ElaB/YqjD/DUF883 family membrane-anchored ribosome-binding protein
MAPTITKDPSLKEVKSIVNEAKSDLKGKVQKVENTALKLVHNASDGISHSIDVVKDEIRSKPLRSSAIALGVGVVLGALFARR